MWIFVCIFNDEFVLMMINDIVMHLKQQVVILVCGGGK